MALPAAKLEERGDAAVRLEVADRISDEAHARVRAWLAALDHDRPAWVVDVVPAYRSLLVIYDPARATSADVRAFVAGCAERPLVVPPARTVEIPVLYDPSVAPDLEPLAAAKGLTAAELVRLHAAPVYRVHMLGFKPGFPYLAGLDPRLAAPRHAVPRPVVTAGSVAIGGAQAGIYPVTSPGGWHVIGRTPLRVFDPARPELFLLGIGDEVRFVPIDAQRFAALERA